MEFIDSESDGDENLEECLTDFPQAPDPEVPRKRRGTPSELSDEQLHNRRDQLLQAFEGMWAEIGWELSRCKRPDTLSSILRPLSDTFVRDIIAVFFRPSTEKPSAQRLRKLRKDARAIEKLRAQQQLENEAVRQRLQEVDLVFLALVRARKGEIRRVRRARKKRRKEFSVSDQQFRAVIARQRALTQEIRNIEPSFARQQLYRFLKSRRYELNPLNLANAVAGLPHMGWRQSITRCEPADCEIANGLWHQVFKAIRYLVKTTNPKTEPVLLNRFRTGILDLPSRYAQAKAKLDEDWYFVESAIKQACRAKPHPKSLPFEIMKRYLKRIQSRSAVDHVLAQQARLSLQPKQRRQE